MTESDFDPIAEALEREFQVAARHAPVPPADVVWLRAQMRAREDAARKAVRPLVIGQALGVAACIGLLAALLSHVTLPALPEMPMLSFRTAGAIVLASTALLLAPVLAFIALAARD